MALDLADLPTRRLLVRRLTMADLGSCHRLYLDVGWADAALSESETLDRRRAWLDWTVRSYDQLLALTQPPYGERAVVRRDSGEFIGLVGLVPLLAPFGQLPAFGGIANARYEPAVGMFWCMLPDQQRRGYATEAASELAHWALANLDLKRIVAGTERDNLASIGVMRAIGMTIEENPFPEPPWFQITGILEPRD